MPSLLEKKLLLELHIGNIGKRVLITVMIKEGLGSMSTRFATAPPRPPLVQMAVSPQPTCRSSIQWTVRRSATNSRADNSEDWVNLPPIRQIKNAIARQRVSEGISYVLPIHKTKCSVEGVYHTNLRVMFQEPYLNEDPRSYNEDKVGCNLKNHFVTNRLSSRGSAPLQRTEIKLNADSEKVRENFNQTMPSTGNRRGDVKQRSGLFLPIHAKISPEAERLKEEVKEILKSVQTERGEEEVPVEEELRSNPQLKHVRNEGQQSQNASERSRKLSRKPSTVRIPNQTQASQEQKDRDNDAEMMKKTVMFNSYEALKTAELPDRYEAPVALIPPYMSETKANEIWQWLHNGEKPNEFSHFLSVCS
ncbi:hypothetical protein CAPTEDRAFT_207636 [Capitella teleta]|uniref:Uncharacterized protein n=1 Tax=Capitella teleta TaxID=283909 RepID=R7TLU8_CAPTE|nr:hypothetical protein CAPTEDRAFT_207636 [Capitella teleta]|eukprot:ELT94492.1 hypothetical protein CAPTEDRAFT_207636 [Capitella teleta]